MTKEPHGKEKHEMTKKKCMILLTAILLAFQLAGCSWWDRMKVDIASDKAGGLQRTIRIYTQDGELMAEYEGRIDIESDTNGCLKFDYDGKRYIYYNAIVESIADIENIE